MEKKISVGAIVAILLIISAGLLVYLTLERGKEHKEIIKKIDNIQEVQVETIELLSGDLVFIGKRLKFIEKKIDNLAKKPKVITKTIKAPVEKKAEEPKNVEKTTSSVQSSSTSTTTNTKNITNVQNVRNEARRNHYSKDRRPVKSDGDCDCDDEDDDDDDEEGDEDEEECDC
ncbi:MAG: hypothetical protein WC280_02825 [Patescibacteria group bacterium]